MRLGNFCLAAAGLILLATAPGRASLHQPADPMAVPVSAKGEPNPLPFDEFKRRLVTLRNYATPITPAGVPTEDRKKIEKRIADARKKRNRTELESVALAVDLLRFGQPLEAETVLERFRQGFLPDVTRAHLAIAQGEWTRAFDYLDISGDERPPPADQLGLTPAQLAWQRKLNRGPLMKFVRLRGAEAKGAKPPPETERPDRIFDVNFVNAAGVYEPGTLAPAEKAKLPPDALAAVQQLVLWMPTDPRLYWLLGELYAVSGEFAAARKIMDECVSSLQYSNRKVLMEHRDAVTKVAKEQAPTAAADQPLGAPPAAPPPEKSAPPDVPFSMGAVWVYFGAVGVIALFAAARAVLKRRSAPRGPTA